MKKLFFSIVALAGLSFGAMAQADDADDSHVVTIVIPEVALLDLESAAKDFSMAFVAPTEAGNGLTAPVDNATVWINYSSVKSAADPTRKVSVSSSAVVSGVNLKVTAGADAAAGSGTVGTPSAQLTLTAAPQDILTGITSAYTGTGVSKGHLLTYNASVSTFADLTATLGTALTVTYTLSDN